MIARALYHDARVLVLDEPSVSLTIEEIAQLHRIVRSCATAAQSIVYVSHRLNEIVALTDRVVVMQDGVVTLERATSETQRAVARRRDRRLGSAADRMALPRPCNSRREADRCCASRASAARRRGRRLVRALCRRDPRAGRARRLGADRGGADDLRRRHAAAGLDRGRRPTGSLPRPGRRDAPRDRAAAGGPPPRGARPGFRCPREHHARVARAHRRHRLAAVAAPLEASGARPATIDRAARRSHAQDSSSEVRRLSGGNQQKVVLAKWLQRSEPGAASSTSRRRGSTSGRRPEIFALIRELAAEGSGIIVICSDFAELATVCTRVVVLREGRVAGELVAATRSPRRRSSGSRTRIPTTPAEASRPTAERMSEGG